MAFKSVAAALAGMCVVFVAAPAVADDNGLGPALHSISREKGRTCFADHWHTWSGGIQRTQKAAIAEAVKGWTSFTALEYGTDWAHFSKAAAKKIGCTKSGDGFGCTVEGRPCK